MDKYTFPDLPASALQHPCDPASLGFTTTDELPILQDVIGQPRALRALELGSEVSGAGYNIFVFGSPSSGRTTLSQRYLENKAAQEPRPADWCYVFNFDNPYQPRALRLPAGQGVEFRHAMQELVAYCQREIPKGLESQEYIQDRDRIVNELKANQEKEFQRLQDYVGKYKFILIRTSSGIILTPGIDGQPLKPEEVEKLSDEQQEKLQALSIKLSEKVEVTLSQIREMGRTADVKLAELTQRMAIFLIEPLIRTLKQDFGPTPAATASLSVKAPVEAVPFSVMTYLDAVQADISANANQFKPKETPEQPFPFGGGDWTLRYKVNVLVDNSSAAGAPVIVENQPTYQNLLGRIEHEVVLGAGRTDFTMIRPGALHRANGGYLILPARDLLSNPFAWEALKRVLRDGVIRIIELGNLMGMVSTQTLEPEPIPLNLKVLLIGTPLLHHLLRSYDEDFPKLFKVPAEFATRMDRTPAAEHEYGLFIKSVLTDHNLPAFANTAVARVIEHSSRLAEDQHKLTTRFGVIADLVREAAYWSRKENLDVVDAASVQRAIDEAIYRNNLFEERLQEMVTQDILLIDTGGAVSGQINALSVLSLGDYAFGRPCRVTAAVHPGQGGILDIERQAKLGGPLHTKGVLILSGLLGGRYGQNRSLNLSASLTFEQSYDEVEGDSASAAELLALLSAIAEIPLRQDRAITGSLNQRGQIQAIGGVNEKVEGFFAVCKERGLNGEQGVLIPQANQRHLMLRSEIIEAVSAGQFHIWPVSTIDQCLALLTDLPARDLLPDGSYPEGSFNQHVAARLDEFSRLAIPPTKGRAQPSGPEEPD